MRKPTSKDDDTASDDACSDEKQEGNGRTLGMYGGISAWTVDDDRAPYASVSAVLIAIVSCGFIDVNWFEKNNGRVNHRSINLFDRSVKLILWGDCYSTD